MRRGGATGIRGVSLVALTLVSSVAPGAARVVDAPRRSADAPRPGADAPWEETSPGFVVPDDTFLREQWWLFNFGQRIGGQVEGRAGADLRAPEAWKITRGAPEVVVAVLDGGIDHDHPEFDGQIWTNPGETGDGRDANGVDDDGNGYVDDWRGWDFVGNDNDPLDEDGHGTAVAGVVAARGGDGTGITGIAPGARIMPLRVADERGGFDFGLTPSAIEYAAAMGARVVVQSYTSDPSGLFDRSGPETAAMEAHPELLFVTGAGNDGNDYGGFEGRAGALKPCNNPTVPHLICVGGTTRDDEAWDESTFGAGRVHIAAPAESMLVVARPREVVFEDEFADPGRWVEATAADGQFAPVGTAAQFDFSADADATDGAALRITRQAPDAVRSRTVLRFREKLDLTGRTGCDINAMVEGTTTGSGTVQIGLYRDSDARFNAFGGDLVIGPAFDAAGELAPYSDYVDDTTEPLELAIAVDDPGGETIDVTVDRLTIECWRLEHGERDYEYWAGTSFATPLVAGVAALVASAHPTLDPMQIRQAVLESAVALPSLDGLVATGGRVDAFGALQRAAELAGGTPPPTTAPPEGDTTAAPGGTGTAVSFGPHLDYLMPDRGEPVPAGRDAADPLAGAGPGGDDQPDAGAPSAGGGARAEEGGGDGGGLSPVVALGGGLFLVTVGGAAYYVRRRRDGSYEVVGKQGVSTTTSAVPTQAGELVVTDDDAEGVGVAVHRDEVTGSVTHRHHVSATVVEESATGSLGSEGQVVGNVEVEEGELEVEVSAQGSVGATGKVEVTASREYLHSTFGAEAFAGAQGSVGAEAEVSAEGVELEAEAEAFVGVEGELSGGFGTTGIDIDTTVSGQLGYGAKAGAAVEVSPDEIVLSMKGSLAIGAGGGGGFTVRVRPDEIGNVFRNAFTPTP
jgi:subtilisin family serine protease